MGCVCADMQLCGDAPVRISVYVVMLIHRWETRCSEVCDFMVCGD